MKKVERDMSSARMIVLSIKAYYFALRVMERKEKKNVQLTLLPRYKTLYTNIIGMILEAVH